MSLTMDPVPPFSHLSSQQHNQQHHQQQQQHRNNHHHLLSPLHPVPRPALPSTSTSTTKQHPSLYNPLNRPAQRAGSGPDTSLSISTTAASSSHNKDRLPLSPANPIQTTWSPSKINAAARPHTYLQQQADTNNSPSHPAPSPSWLLPTPPQQANTAAQNPHSHPSLPPTPTSASTMGSLHYAMPAHYGLGIDESTLQNQGYHLDHPFRAAVPQQPAASSHQTHYDYSQSEAYGTHMMRTGSPLPTASQYTDEYRVSAYSHAPGIAPRTMPATPMSSASSSFSSPNLYESGIYPHQQMAHGVVPTQMPHNLAYPQSMYSASSIHALPRSLAGINSGPPTTRANQKPKPQCWEHGCNGRRFSTFSNLLRHQREKSGTATKSYCPRCGAEFTRTTARNGHLAHDKCTKVRKDSVDSQ